MKDPAVYDPNSLMHYSSEPPPKARYKVPRRAYYCHTTWAKGTWTAISHQFVLTRGAISGELFARLDEAIRQCGTGVTYTRGHFSHVWSVPASNGTTALSQAILPFCA